MMRRKLTHSKHTNLVRAVGRLVLIVSTTGVISLVSNWSNYHSYKKLEIPPQQESIFSLITHQNKDQYLPYLLSDFLQNYLQWLKNPWQDKGLSGIYLSNTLFFVASSVLTWTAIEIIVYQKLYQQRKTQQKINYLKSQLAQQNHHNKKRSQALNKLRNKLSSGDKYNKKSASSSSNSLINPRISSSPNSPEQTNHLQKLQQDIHQTQQQASQVRHHAESLNQTLISLAINTASSHTQNQVEQELETALEIITEELKNAKELEQYLIEEYHLLEIENQNLSRDLRLSQQKIRYLSHRTEKQKLQLNQANQNNEGQNQNLPVMIVFSATARDNLTKIYHLEPIKYHKVLKALVLMRDNLRHPSLSTHEYHSLRAPNGQKMFESYVENRTPSAWRIFWYYGPGNRFLTIHSITQHPE